MRQSRSLVPLAVSIGILLGAVVSGVAHAQSTAPLAVYGVSASTAEGDDDHVQVVFVHVPAELDESLYLRLFDADCGGAHDQVAVDPDTSTRFTLYGGEGALTAPGVREAHPSGDALASGTVLEGASFTVDPALDNEWHTFAVLSPADGEEVGGERVFRLVVEGESGDDGNVFDVALSRSDRRNDPPGDVRVVNYSPTIRLAGIHVAAELRFVIPADAAEVAVGNFDTAGARITLDTAHRSVELGSSGQGEASEHAVVLAAGEAGQVAALTFGGGGGEDPNDATFWVVDGSGQPIAIDHPVWVGRRNSRPVARVATRPLADCYSVVLDGTLTSDDDDELLQLNWDLGDGQTARGRQLVHRYDSPGTYSCRLTVTDSSGRVGNSAVEEFAVVVNDPPSSEAGPDLVGEPGQPVRFDGGGSADADGRVVRYLWDFADGETGEGQSASHVFAEPGKYIVALQVEDDSSSPCNFSTDYVTVWVNYPPVAEAGEDINCSVGEVITVDGGRSYDTDGEITSYSWTFGDGSAARSAVAEHAFDAPGTYEVILRVADDAGARNSVSSDRVTVFVNDPPVAGAGADRRVAIGEVSVFDGSSSIDRDGRIVSYTWDFGDGHTGQGRIIPYAYNDPGVYTVTLTVRDNSPAESGVHTDALDVEVNAPPVAVAGNDRVVTSSEVAFDGTTSSDPDGGSLNYRWSFGDGTTASGAAPVHVYSRPGMYMATLKVTDDSGTPLNEALDRLIVVVNERPIADAGRDRIAAPGDPVAFQAFDSLDPDGEIVDFAWDFGDGSTDTGRSVTHAYSKPGAYTVRLMVRDDTEQENAVDFDQAVVTVNAQPAANAGTDVLAAPDQEIRFDGSASFDIDGTISTYEWRFSDGQGSAAAPVTARSFSQPGLYTARLTVIDDSGASNDLHQDEVAIRINHRPRAVPGQDIYTCDGLISFDGSRSIDGDGDALTFSWGFGDGQTASGAFVSHTYAAGGTYPVTLTVDDGTGLANSRHSDAMTVTINRPPNADAGQALTVCAGETALFDGSSSADPEGGLLRYRWDMGDGTSFEGVHPTKIYTEGGVYTVQLVVEDDSGLECDSDTDQVTVRVAESPVADAGSDVSVCANSRVRFDGSGSRDFDGVVNRYVWDFGDGTRGGGANPEHTFTEPGEYAVRLTVTGDQVGTCDNTDVDEMMVTVLQAPVAVIVGRDVVPVGEPMMFDGSRSSGEGATIVNWVWDFGDGGTADGESASHAFETAGRFPVSLQVTTDADVTCGTVGVQKMVVVNQPPVAVAGDQLLVGVNHPVELDASGSSDPDGVIVDYEWDFGDGSTASGVNALHRFAASGEYAVVLRVRDDAGIENSSSSDTVTVTVNAAPKPVIAVVPAGCAGSEVAFSAAQSVDTDGEITSYGWSFGDGQMADGAEVVHVYERPGRYHVTLVVDDGAGVTNSRAETALSFPVNQPPTAQAGADLIACVGEDVVFDGAGSVDPDGRLVSHRWDFSDGGQADGERVTHAFAEAGAYTVRLTVGDSLGLECGQASDTLQARINSRPVAVAGADRQAYVGGAHDAVLFDGSESYDADGDPLTYVWDFGDDSTDTGAKVFHAFAEPGRYMVRLTVRDGTGVACSEAVDDLVVTVTTRE